MDINWIVDSPFEQLPVGDPTAVALALDGVETMTYADLQATRNRYIDILRQAGVQQGDRVGMLLLNSLDYVALYFAITRIGAIAVRLNFRLAPTELQYVLTDSGCTVVVLHSSRIGQIEPIRDQVPAGTWLVLPDDATPVPAWATRAALESASTGECGLPRPAGTDPLMLMYTSGTTGRPKGVVWSHDNALWLALMQATKWSYTDRTVAMTTGPLYHAGAFEVLLLPALFVHGTAVPMSSGGLSTGRIIETIKSASVTHVLLYPFLLYGLLREPGLQRESIASLRAVLGGGDPVLPWALEAMDERFPGLELQQGYGLTEGGTMSTCLDHQFNQAHPDSVGRPMPMTQVQVMSADGGVASPGVVGEVWVRSPTVAQGYWGKPEETAETFVNGWCRTGDLGRVTDDGFLVLTGRAKDMIRSGGENVYPAEVESVLARHPDVSAVAVIAVPDPRYLEVGCAVIVRTQPGGGRSDELIEGELRSLARDRLAGYKCPRHYAFVDELPVNASGKLQKHLLRTTFAEVGAEVPEVTR